MNEASSMKLLWRPARLIGRSMAAFALFTVAVGSAFAEHDIRHAKPLPLGVPERATLEDGDVRYYRFDLDGAATVVLTAWGKADLFGTLIGGDGEEIASDDDSGAGLNFRITADLASGPYYLKVEALDGATYSLRAYVPRDDDHGDTALTSTRLPVNIAYAGRINSADDADVFRLDIAQGSSVTIVAGGGIDTDGELVDSEGRTVAQATDGGGGDNFRMEEVLEAGVYYLTVRSTERGTYTVRLDDGRGPPRKDVSSLLGGWFGTWRWTTLGWRSSPDLWVLDRVFSEDGVRWAVEDDFTPSGWLYDTDENYYLGVRVSDFGVQIEGIDYVVWYRGFDILCLAYGFSLRSATQVGDGALLFFGDYDDVEGECTFADASVYDAAVAHAFLLTDARSAGVHRGATDARRQMDAARERLLHSLPPSSRSVEGIGEVLSAMQQTLQ